MQKQFVPYHIAKELKEIGFDKICISLITENNYLQMLDARDYENLEFYQRIAKINNVPCVPAPLYQQVIDWFLDKKILIEVSLLDSWNNWIYRISMQDCISPFFTVPTDYIEFKTRTEALTAAIEHAIKLVKNQINKHYGI